MLGGFQVEKLHVLTRIDLRIEPKKDHEHAHNLPEDRIAEPALRVVIVMHTLAEREPGRLPFDLSRLRDFCRCAIRDGETGTGNLFFDGQNFEIENIQNVRQNQ